METVTYIQDYYGKKNVIAKSKSKESMIFVIDDSKLYSSILSGTLKRKGHDVYTFSSGEEAMDYMSLNPDIVIIDYHLDGVNPYNDKADVICKSIKESNPLTKIIVITSDRKFKKLKSLLYANSLIIKDSDALRKISKSISFLQFDANYLASQSLRMRFLGVIRFLILLFIFSFLLLAILGLLK
jgi:CheY-like chemotaxis protein